MLTVRVPTKIIAWEYAIGDLASFYGSISFLIHGLISLSANFPNCMNLVIWDNLVLVEWDTHLYQSDITPKTFFQGSNGYKCCFGG